MSEFGTKRWVKVVYDLRKPSARIQNLTSNGKLDFGSSLWCQIASNEMRNEILGSYVKRVIKKCLPCLPIDDETIDYDTGK
jgi:hypothetical protein